MRRIILGTFFLTSAIALAQTPATPPPSQPPAATPASGASESNVVYGVVDGTKLLLDVYRPATGKPPYPAVILIHGGGWSAFDKSTMAGMGRLLAHYGFVAFAIDYRLLSGPKNLWPAQLDDAQRAVRWVRANAKKYDVDPAHIGAFGHSAGAQMAALLGELDTRDNSDPALAAYSSKVQAVVDVDGPTDFTIVRDPEDLPFLAHLFGGSQEQKPNVWKSASPALNVTRETAPFLIFHGTQDHEVDITQAEELVAALEKDGVPVTFFKVDDVHTYQTQAARRQLALETVAFFDKTLKPAAAK